MSGRSWNEPPSELELAVELRRVTAELNTALPWRESFHAIVPAYEQARTALGHVQLSHFWKLRQSCFAWMQRLGLSRRGALPTITLPPAGQLVADDPYARWRAQHDFRAADAEWMQRAVKAMRLRPRFSFIVPTYNPQEVYLRAMLDSVLAQVYPDWELCIADDASTQPHVRRLLEDYAVADARIKVTYRSENGHISAASNSAIELATGEFFALLDHDDAIAPDALFQYALAINEDPSLDMLYSDEDKIDDSGARFNPFFKPDWSPDRFLSVMYTSHLGAYRAELVRELGGFRLGFEGSQDYDLVLRLVERTHRVHHVPRVLYHWRVHAESTTSGMDVKPYARDAALTALREALERRGEPGTVSANDEMPGTYTVRYAIREPGRVSVIVPTRDHADDVERCLESIFTLTTYPDFEVILLDNGSTNHVALETFARWTRREPERLSVIRYDIPFNYSAINNYAARHATGRYLLFLNNDTQVIEGDWMQAMVEQAQRSTIGAVGARLLYADDRIQHAGVVLGIGGIAGHAFRFYDRDHLGYYNCLQSVTNYSAVTAACLMTRREIFEQVGGFDEQLAVAYNDVDLCLRIGQLGYRIVYVPQSLLYHYESKTRGYDFTPAQIERDNVEKAYMERRWRFSTIRDPYYNPNFTLVREDFSLAESD